MTLVISFSSHIFQYAFSICRRRDSNLTGSVQVVAIFVRSFFASKIAVNLFESALRPAKAGLRLLVTSSFHSLCRRRDSNPHPLRDMILSHACIPFHHFGIKHLRPGGESNSRIRVLQTLALPLGYQAIALFNQI